MKKMKVKSVNVKIILPTSILAVLLLISGIISIRNVNSMMKGSKEISDNYAMSLSYLGEVSEHFQSLHGIIYAHCLAGDSASKESLTAEENQMRIKIQDAF